jgi:hypothetical protein
MAMIGLENFSTPLLQPSIPKLVYVNIHKVNALKMGFPRINLVLFYTVPPSTFHCSVKTRDLLASPLREYMRLQASEMPVHK